MRMNCVLAVLVVTAGFIASACSHVGRLALLSNGDLDGKDLTTLSSGPILQGKDCFNDHYLSRAFADAVQDTTYDTLVDVEVTTTTGVFVWNNCIQIKGKGAESVKGKGIKNAKVELAAYQNSPNRTPSPIRYVALEMPKTMPASGGPYVEATRGRFGILYRPPQDVEGLIRELNNEARSQVLRDVDVTLMTPYCIVIVCVGGDSASGHGTKSVSSGSEGQVLH